MVELEVNSTHGKIYYRGTRTRTQHKRNAEEGEGLGREKSNGQSVSCDMFLPCISTYTVPRHATQSSS